MSQDLLAGQGAVVVGGSRGIGRAVVELLGQLGAGVVVNGREADAAQDAVAAIRGSGGRATALAGAADNESIATALVDECLEQFGRLDILINCAGIAEPAGTSILNVLPADFDAQIKAHLGTTFHTCRAAARIMAAQGSGAIVNSSSVAFLGDYGGTGYPAGKGAVNGFTMAIAAELKSRGVRANVVCPGAKTRLSTGVEYEEHIADLYRRGLLNEMTMRASLDAAPAAFVAPVYAYLASDLARQVTGEMFVAAGGFIGEFDRPTPRVLAYRDHRDSQPWSVYEVQAMLAARPQPPNR